MNIEKLYNDLCELLWDIAREGYFESGDIMQECLDRNPELVTEYLMTFGYSLEDYNDCCDAEEVIKEIWEYEQYEGDLLEYAHTFQDWSDFFHQENEDNGDGTPMVQLYDNATSIVKAWQKAYNDLEQENKLLKLQLQQISKIINNDQQLRHNP